MLGVFEPLGDRRGKTGGKKKKGFATNPAGGKHEGGGGGKNTQSQKWTPLRSTGVGGGLEGSFFC